MEKNYYLITIASRRHPAGDHEYETTTLDKDPIKWFAELCLLEDRWKGYSLIGYWPIDADTYETLYKVM